MTKPEKAAVKGKNMTIWESIIYGIIQGLTEFLPVSSSGHLAILQTIFKSGFGEDSLSFSVLLHLGTLLAVFIVYAKDIWELICSFFTLCGKLIHKKHKMEDFTVSERMVIFVLIATLPLIPAALLDKYIAALSGYVWAVGLILIVNAVMLYISDKLARENLYPEEVKPKNALVVGLVQVFAVLPGLSRSGSTITAGLSQGFRREYAVKFSFILSIPAILGACVLELPDFISQTLAENDTSLLLTYIAGALSAMIVGILAIKLLIMISKKSNFRVFSYYCAAAGALAIVLGIIGLF